MTRDNEMRVLESMDSRSKDILIKKGEDYATADVLSNFKRISGAVKALGLDTSTPAGYAMFMALMKIDRINNLISTKKVPNNESIRDSFEDGINYMKLAYMCYLEVNFDPSK